MTQPGCRLCSARNKHASPATPITASKRRSNKIADAFEHPRSRSASSTVPVLPPRNPSSRLSNWLWKWGFTPQTLEASVTDRPSLRNGSRRRCFIAYKPRNLCEKLSAPEAANAVAEGTGNSFAAVKATRSSLYGLAHNLLEFPTSHTCSAVRRFALTVPCFPRRDSSLDVSGNPSRGEVVSIIERERNPPGDRWQTHL